MKTYRVIVTNDDEQKPLDMGLPDKPNIGETLIIPPFNRRVTVKNVIHVNGCNTSLICEL